MSLWRYNRLRKRGYRTIGGGNWGDDFGQQWVELMMRKDLKIKKVRINGSTRVRDFIDIEYATDNPNAQAGKEDQK